MGRLSLPEGQSLSTLISPSVVVAPIASNGFGRPRVFSNLKIEPGQTFADYKIDAIEDGDDIQGYMISLICIDCGEIVRRVYRNKNGEVESVFNMETQFIPRQNFPERFDATLLKGTAISGKLVLPTANNTGRTLIFSVKALEKQEFISSFNEETVSISPGESSAAYTILRLPPASGLNFDVSYTCENCGPEFVDFGSHQNGVASGSDSSGVNIFISSSGVNISGRVDFPFSLEPMGFLSLELSWAVDDFLVVVRRSISIQEFFDERGFDFDFLVPLDVGGVRLQYVCSGCSGVFPGGFFNSDEPIYNASTMSEVIQLTDQGFMADFSLIADANADGIADPALSLAPIYNLLFGKPD